jgi:hypothetical protein
VASDDGVICADRTTDRQAHTRAAAAARYGIDSVRHVHADDDRRCLAGCGQFGEVRMITWRSRCSLVPPRNPPVPVGAPPMKLQLNGTKSLETQPNTRYSSQLPEGPSVDP